MEQLHARRLLDDRGRPLSARIDDTLRSLVPKFRRQFPAVQDELDVLEILEKAGTKIAVREQRSGPIEKLHAYAWVTLKSVTASWLRRGATRLRGKSLGSEASDAIFSTIHARSGSPAQMEQEILLREARAHLTEDEWTVCALKMMGFSGEEIARRRGSSTAAANMVFSRAIQKLRKFLSGPEARTPPREPGPAASTSSRSSLRSAPPERADGESAPDT